MQGLREENNRLGSSRNIRKEDISFQPLCVKIAHTWKESAANSIGEQDRKVGSKILPKFENVQKSQSDQASDRTFIATFGCVF